MSGIIAVYALVVAVLIAGNMKPPPERTYSLFQGCMHLACGLSVGLTGTAAGYAIGVVGDTVSEWRSLWVQQHAERIYHRVYERICSNRGSLSEWC